MTLALPDAYLWLAPFLGTLLVMSVALLVGALIARAAIAKAEG